MKKINKIKKNKYLKDWRHKKGISKIYYGFPIPTKILKKV